MKRAQRRKDLRESSRPEMERMLQEERKNLFMSRRDVATKQLDNPKKIKESRKNIARILTIMREQELAAEKGSK